MPTDWFNQMQSLLASMPSAYSFAACACDWPGVEGPVARLVSYTSCDQVHPIPRPPPQTPEVGDIPGCTMSSEMMSMVMSSMRLFLITKLTTSQII